jgi:ferrous iron transport protein A
MHKLTQANANVNLIFISLEGGRGAAQRLTDMGLIPGERLKVLHNTGFGPVTVLIKETKVALGHGLASKIIVKEE